MATPLTQSDQSAVVRYSYRVESRLGPDDFTTVYHATSREDAENYVKDYVKKGYQHRVLRATWEEVEGWH